MATKPRIFVSEQSRRSIISQIEKPEVMRAFRDGAAREAALKSSIGVQVLARQRQQERHIDQAVRSMPVQV